MKAPHDTTARQIPAWSETVGPGWASLLDRLHHDLQAIDADYRIESFAVKLGGLRVSVADRFDEHGEFDGEFADCVTALTDSAETASEHTCETCGSEGRIRLRGDDQHTWMQAICDACRTTRPPHVLPTAAHGAG
ncbi:hypothetical protein [Streptomyces flavofungini]|uniref:hypothetical protein n=1 Tax=Streptomyces flavofungini TaxID=68200 RepID=UPI0025AF1B80|nr:hypothetical protein [Streptomyces flavofungini]WJV51736.1 hypothetical protein QUY26_39600 [Streptomyces flavofungini]